MSRLIVVVGFMGCGKTEVASRLATKLDLPFVDLDELITQSEGHSPAQLIREHGEQSFRAIETRVLTGLVERYQAAVVALGGGAWIEKANRQLITQIGAVSIWLDTPFEVCWKRISTSSDDRPLGATREEAETRYHKRLPIYQLADIAVSATAQADPDTLASRIQHDILKLDNS
jgi:shikimate kinase